MSCIQHLAKLKGDKEPFFLNQSCVLEDTGQYKGYDYCVVFIETGHRCGYVALPRNHFLLKNNSDLTDDNDLIVHGGITFQNKPIHILDEHLWENKGCGDIWIGFCAAHAGDNQDFELSSKIFGKNIYSKDFIDRMKVSSYEIRTKEYMIGECKNLIDQIVERDFKD